MKPKREKAPKKRWTMVFESNEAAANLYCFLDAFASPSGKGVLDTEGLTYVRRWRKVLEKNVPGIRGLIDDNRGPRRQMDNSPMNLAIELDYRERQVMLFICRTAIHRLTTIQYMEDWIRSHGRSDYELAVDNYRRWLEALDPQMPSIHSPTD